jgi:hypothetical protein
MRRMGFAASLMGGLAGCVPDRPIAPLVEECREGLAAVVYEHACQHGRLGPFEKATAVTDEAFLLSPVSARQRTIEVTLPHGSDDDRVSYLLYTPSRDGQHAVFTGSQSAAVGITAWRGVEPVPRIPIEAVRDSGGCGGMVEVTGFELKAGERYVFEIGPTNAPAMKMFIEHVGSFGTQWSSQCPR